MSKIVSKMFFIVGICLSGSLLADTESTFDHHTYKAFSEKVPWHVAKENCHKMGGYLATLTSEAENEHVASILKGNSWVGGNDEVNEGNWVWVTGEKLSFQNWKQGEPNNAATKENGLQLLGDGQWNDLTMDRRIPYVCEWGAAN